jgi:hypothetical protein
MVIRGEEERAQETAESIAFATIRDRLFIVDELKEIRALDRWTEANRDFQNNHNVTQFTERFVDLNQDIRDAAARTIRAA